MSSNGCGLGGPSGVSLVSLGSPVPSARGSLRRKPIPTPRNNTLKKPEGKGKSDRDSQVRDRTRSEHKGRRELSRSISDVQNIPVLCASLFYRGNCRRRPIFLSYSPPSLIEAAGAHSIALLLLLF